MRHIIYLGGRQFGIDDQNTYTHCVVAKLNHEPFVPRGRAMTAKEIAEHPEKDAIHEELRAFALDETAGKFALKPVEWCANEGEANIVCAALLAEDASAKWTDVRAVTVNTVLQHA